MITKRILVPSRLRRPPTTGWSWTDGRFVREHMDHLSREAVLLYFFLSAVAACGVELIHVIARDLAPSLKRVAVKMLPTPISWRTTPDAL